MTMSLLGNFGVMSISSTVGDRLVAYDIDRNTASKLLKVSVRTIDRYIRDGRVSVKREDGRIWLSRSEIMGFRDHRDERRARHIIAKEMVESSIENEYDISPKVSSTLSSFERNVDVADSIYKNLYEEAKVQLEDQQKRLEGANYRVGQLEAELKSSIPLVQFQQNERKYLESHEDMKLRLEQTGKKYQEIHQRYRIEKYNKFIYLVISFVLLALQPLWLFFGD